MFNVLKYMVPSFVIVPMLKNPSSSVEVTAQVHASVMFISIVGFDEKARCLSAEELLRFLNRSFTEFDNVCQAHQVTKIETWKEEFVCAVGVVPSDVAENNRSGHSEILARLVLAALDMLNIETTPGTNTTGASTIAFKVGIHTGPVVAGVVGGKLPRFRLFGDTVNMAARMMQKGVAGQVQFGEETLRELPHWAAKHVARRGDVAMKGKDGPVAVYTIKGTSEDLHLDRPAAERTVSLFGPISGRSPTDDARSLAKTGILGALLGKTGPRLSIRTPRRLPREYVAATEFEKMLREMGVRPDETEFAKGGLRRFRCLGRCCRPWADFPEKAEDDFQVWFHEHKTCRNVVKRLAYHATILASMSVFEFVYLLYLFEALDMMQVYILCRIICCVILFGARAVMIHSRLGPSRHRRVSTSVAAVAWSRWLGRRIGVDLQCGNPPVYIV
ncbi:unnamed protein product [Prorocentrum cordatum]|uniref:Guanylate cyclase domain-containing protein n=1 Tax=Prorocentrum cordatum TaxID=2364126 RepID=A0ABN9WQU6_9DINO|nr:unnamed protein product [Polarella glacialis]